MKLSQYLREKKISQKLAAEKLNVSQQMISQLVLESTKPGLELVNDIQTFTKGQVKLKDWL